MEVVSLARAIAVDEIDWKFDLGLLNDEVSTKADECTVSRNSCRVTPRIGR